MFITGRPSNLDPPVIIILPLNILHPRAQSFPLKFSVFAYPPISTVNEWQGLKITLSSSQMDLNLYPLNVLFHMHLSGLTRWSFLRWDILQYRHVFFAGVSLFSFFIFFSFLLCALAPLSFLWSRLHGLRSSSDDSCPGHLG